MKGKRKQLSLKKILGLNKEEASWLAKGKMRAYKKGSEGFGSCW